MTPIAVRRIAGWLVLFAAAALAIAAEPEGPRARPRPVPARPAIGQEAPDFELPRLAFEKNDKGDTIGKVSAEKVRLTSYRTKRPVCLFLSSYT